MIDSSKTGVFLQWKNEKNYPFCSQFSWLRFPSLNLSVRSLKEKRLRVRVRVRVIGHISSPSLSRAQGLKCFRLVPGLPMDRSRLCAFQPRLQRSCEGDGGREGRVSLSTMNSRKVTFRND